MSYHKNQQFTKTGQCTEFEPSELYHLI